MRYTDHSFLQFAEQIYNDKQLDVALSDMAELITQDLIADEEDKPLVIGIMNGALITVGQLLPKLNISVDVDYCHATRYNNKTLGGELHWLVYPQHSLAGRKILLVDDIFDEGITLKLIAEYCKSEGASDVKAAVLLDKEHDRKVNGFSVDYSALTIVDRYVFGFGLDYKGAFRNAPGIYALIDEE